MARADHIKVRRLGMIYAHHGIDMGDETVVHYVEKKKATHAQVERTSMDGFLKGGRLRTVKHKNPLAPEITISLAKTELGRKDYHLVWNNCEHFATYCKTGKKKSKQVWRGVAGAASLVLAAAAGLIVRKKRKNQPQRKNPNST